MQVNVCQTIPTWRAARHWSLTAPGWQIFPRSRKRWISPLSEDEPKSSYSRHSFTTLEFIHIKCLQIINLTIRLISYLFIYLCLLLDWLFIVFGRFYFLKINKMMKSSFPALFCELIDGLTIWQPLIIIREEGGVPAQSVRRSRAMRFRFR